jgi:hypothetical protein
MIKPLVIPQILVDIYHNGVYQFTVNEFTQLDIRRQIVKEKQEGYAIKMNPQFYYLFDKDDEIEDTVITISSDGQLSDWFPSYKLNDEYQLVAVFQESLAAVLKMHKLKRDEK